MPLLELLILAVEGAVEQIIFLVQAAPALSSFVI
jgi:hypothetical protein